MAGKPITRATVYLGSGAKGARLHRALYNWASRRGFFNGDGDPSYGPMIKRMIEDQAHLQVLHGEDYYALPECTPSQAFEDIKKIVSEVCNPADTFLIQDEILKVLDRLVSDGLSLHVARESDPTKTKMAQALIDIHNVLPQSIDEIMAETPEGTEDPYEYLESRLSVWLVELWSILHGFPPNSLEKVTGGGQ